MAIVPFYNPTLSLLQLGIFRVATWIQDEKPPVNLQVTFYKLLFLFSKRRTGERSKCQQNYKLISGGKVLLEVPLKISL